MPVSDFVDHGRYPAVHAFVRDHVDMQFNDVRTMLKLPRAKEGLDAGCNFAAAAVLCNLVSGISATLFSSTRPPKKGQRDSGRLFKESLREFYPWRPRDDERHKALTVNTLYHVIRNPLAHALGLLEEGDPPTSMNKPQEALTESQIRALEIRGYVPARTVTVEGARVLINVPALYAGVYHMVGRLAADDSQLKKAEALLPRASVP